MFYVYVLFDKIKKIFCIGFTSDLQRRLKEHSLGQVQTTKTMTDKTLVYYEGCLSKDDAVLQERQLKTGFGRSYLKRRIESYLKNI